MGYEYTTRDGERLEVNVARAFDQMAAEFRRVFGLNLIVNSGVRTEEEQWRLYNGWINRLPGFYLATTPQNSFHCEVGPQGPRALDLRDSGDDAGVMTIGTTRNNWIRDNGPRWGFTLSGLTFNPAEGWHNHFTGAIGGSGAPSGSFPANERYGADWVKSAQNKLNRLGFNVGEEDGLDGENTQRGVRELQGILDAEQDGIYGPVTNDGADLILAGGNYTSRPVAEIQAIVGATPDGVWGPYTSLHVYVWQKTNGLTRDAQWGPASDAKGFPNAEQPPAPEDWNRTDRPTADIQRAVGMPEAEIDGAYGPNTDKYIREFQTSEGIDSDGIWGETSDGLAFPPAGSIHGVDYSFSRPDPAMMKSRGVKIAGRYLWNTKYQDGRTNKGLGLEEIAALAAQGIEVFFIYEEDGKELRGGFDEGVRVAKAAEVNTAFDAGKIKWGFQTYAWSGGKWDPRAQLQQWSNGQWGDSIDFTRAVKAEFGQNPVKPAPEPEEPEPPVEEESITVTKSKLWEWFKKTFGG
jgi:peptidoglycan hydrolase-like protein with peptidoglycan-binding domain